MSRYIDEHRGRFGVEPICRALGVSASAYYQRATGGAVSPAGVEGVDDLGAVDRFQKQLRGGALSVERQRFGGPEFRPCRRW